ncbi:DUF4397 domain-containing protein [Chitinophaga sp. HK235]|uniref:DUF4397 domain-containing protein n=1 Tax=Chitinophaga sp. HK235 TaxID=2952571 RepID=UPI001BAB26D7|nr:DUF4397 domain-containing protein [Chitinophaga sp. HK235]
MNKFTQLLLIILAGLLHACNKDVTLPDETAKGQISFYFASTALTNGAEARGSKGYLVLIDSRDSSYRPSKDIFSSIYPFLYNPSQRSTTYPQTKTSWIQFMALDAGQHQLFLKDTSSRLLDSVKFTLDADKPAMVFYGDSIGNYSHIIVADPFVADTGKIGIRIINLSPFTGPVYMTLNKVVPSALPAYTQYMDHTGFLPLALSTPQTFNIKVYRYGDDKNFLTRGTLEAIPGHAYTLIISGYSDNNPGGYNDPLTGARRPISNNFSLSVTKTF